MPDATKKDARRRKRKRDAGDAQALQRIVWEVLTRAREITDDPDPDRGVKAAHAVATLSGSWARVHELAEVLPRLEALEQQMQEHRR